MLNITVISFIFLIGLVNWCFQNYHSWIKTIFIAVLIASIVSVLSQIYFYYSDGYLDPFFLIALFIQIFLGSAAGIIVAWLKRKAIKK